MANPRRDEGTAEPSDRAQQRIQLSGRLERIGDRVARIAHEINKPVNLIAGSVENLEEQVPVLVETIRAAQRRGKAVEADRRLEYALESAPALVALCQEGVERLTRMIAQLMAFTRGRPARGTSERLDLVRVVEAAIGWTKRAADAGVSIACEIPTLPPVEGDAAFLTEAFVNILSNAFDAVASTPRPEIRISGNVLSDGRWVEIRILDNGPGISTADREHIFAPFFTTKPAKAGLGLGLAIAREIIESNGGTLGLGAADAPATEFIVRLPVAG